MRAPTPAALAAFVQTPEGVVWLRDRERIFLRAWLGRCGRLGGCAMAQEDLIKCSGISRGDRRLKTPTEARCG
jgi:hypothetical protein